MMRTPKQVIQLLKEKLTPNLQKKVGNVLFGSLNTIAKLQKAKIPVDGSEAELNTAWENDLYANIESWIEVSEVSVAKFFAKNKELLQTLAKEFPSVLQPPIGKLAYRGTSIKIDSLKNAFIKKQYVIVKVGGREVFHFKNLGYIPNRESQSWTVDPKVAFKFEGRANNEDSVRVVYAIRVNKDFIFSPELMNCLVLLLYSFLKLKSLGSSLLSVRVAISYTVIISSILLTGEITPIYRLLSLAAALLYLSIIGLKNGLALDSL